MRTLLVVASLIAGCTRASGAAPPRAARTFGAAVSASAPHVRLDDLVRSSTAYMGRSVRVDGRVVAVCQEMGCWMEIRDDATQAHVRMHGHQFFVPRDVDGHRATVQATLIAAHPQTACDQEAQQASGRVAQLELDATGVEVAN